MPVIRFQRDIEWGIYGGVRGRRPSIVRISALSEQSIALGNHPVVFPDFTAGKWVTANPDFGFSDEF